MNSDSAITTTLNDNQSNTVLEENKNNNQTDKTTTKETQEDTNITTNESVGIGMVNPVSSSDIPTYSGNAYVAINNNQPNFSSKELTTSAYEHYSNLDGLGRCGVAIASCGKEIMPKDGEQRKSISNIKPTGWVQAQYDCVSGKYLYNRCHLIGWQLSAENANNKNLITGTKYLNTSGMLPFENMVADYIDETNNHVAYRVTPVYKGNNLVASGVQIEAYSIEDNGDGICFNVFCYNVQPGVTIDYLTGASYLASTSTTKAPTTTKKQETTTKKQETTTAKQESTTKKTETTTKKPVTTTEKTVTTTQAPITTQKPTTTQASTPDTTTYVLNTNTGVFHRSSCRHIKTMNEENKSYYTGTRDGVISQGYNPCGTCKP
ncbi:MAG: DNA/RNA non-specific endonuclease [Clostridia bacterium]|nr:DNA/RNA non-specific endonuclease [Clostridia bacterium]